MIRWLVDHATTIIIAVLAIGIFGTVSYLTLPRESSPDITIPMVLVSVPYIGVSPQDIESLVTIPIENELAGLQDLEEITSTSAEGVSIIAVEFAPEADPSEVLTNVRDRVSRARPNLPEDVEEPSVQEIAFSDIPILIVNLFGDVDEETLKRLGEELQDEVKRIPGVLDAKLSGGLTREIQVHVDPIRLAHYGLSLADVTSAIGNENVNIPGGEVDSGDATFLVRTPGEFTDARQIEEVAIKRVGDRPVFVRDVATVHDTFADRETLARLNGSPSVSLAVTKRPGSNIIDIADEVKRLAAEQAATWPEGVSFKVLADESFYIRDMVSQLQNNILTALILVVGVILMFMGWRNSLFVALAIPGSMLMSFMILDALGFTLNMMVLFSLILALGMLVDNAIVIVENVFRHVEEGMSRREAAVKGASEVGVAVLASTATTVAAFFPLVFWGGIMGEFMSFLPKTVIIVLVSSLAVAVLFIPVFMSRLMSVRNQGAKVDEQGERKYGRLMRGYRWVLQNSIEHRYLSGAAIGLVFVFSIAAYALLGHGLEFFPATDPDRATIAIRAPDGTDVMTTDRIARQVEHILADEPNVDVFVTEVGVSGGGSRLTGSSAAPNEARISVDFLKDRNAARPGEPVRVESTTLTIDRLRTKLREIPGAEIAIEKQEMGPPVEKPIKVLVSGDDVHEVGRFAEEVRREIAKVPGVTELSDDYRVGRPELQLRIDRGAAKRVGVSTAEIGNTVRTAIAGQVASELRDGDDEYDIVVQLAPEYRSDLQSVLGLRLAGREDTSPDTFPVPLSTVASYALAGGTGSVHHVNQDLVVTIEGEVLDNYSEYDVQQKVAAMLPGLERDGFHLELKGSNEEQAEAMVFLLRALFIAIALILLVLVTQFNSITTPMIILGTVILSTVGVLWGLILTQTPFGVIMTGIGVISLAGVVVNNAIVLLDYVGQLRANGMRVEEALLEAGTTRFRPVMLTAITTVLGLVPMAVGVSFDFTRFRFLLGGASSSFWGPMAVAVIFGLSFATILTLVFVPTLYMIFRDIGKGLSRLTAHAGRRQAAEALAKVLLVGAGIGAAHQAQAITLEDAFAAAESNNLDLQIVEEQTVQAKSLVGQGWSLVSPRLTGELGLQLNELEIAFSPTDGLPPEFQELVGPQEPIVIQEKTQWSGNVTIAQPIFSASALPTLQAAYRMRDAAEADEAATRQSIRSGVAGAYYGLATAREALALAEEAVATAEHQLDLANRQVAAGTAPRRTAIQAELGVSRARRDLAAAREQVVSAEERFTRLTGLDRDVVLELPDVIDIPQSLDAALASAAERPDVQAARLRERAARLEHGAKWAGWLPDVNANFTVVYNEAAGFGGQNTFWTAGVTGRWVFWDGGLRLAQTRDTASRRRVATYAVERAEQVAKEEIRVAWESLERATAALEAVDREVALAEENVRLAETGFVAGTTTWLDVEQAQLGLRQARLAQLQERMTRDLAAVELRRAIGTL